MERSRVPVHDQLAYRTLIHLAGAHNRPAMAVRVLARMRRIGLRPNAITYAHYHRALMRGEWPSETRLAAVEAWRRLALRLEVCAAFRIETSGGEGGGKWIGWLGDPF